MCQITDYYYYYLPITDKIAKNVRTFLGVFEEERKMKTPGNVYLVRKSEDSLVVFNFFKTSTVINTNIYSACYVLLLF